MIFDVAIVGAGIVGAACARECALAGMSTVVIDQAFPAAGATSAGMGHVVVMDDSETQFALTRFSRDLWDVLAPALPASAEYARCGTLWVAADEEELVEVHRKQEFYRARNVPACVLDSNQLREAEPELRPGMPGALLVQGDSVIYPPAAARFLFKHPKIMVQLSRVTRIADEGVELSDGRVDAGIVINACGANAARLTPEIPVSIQPRKGQLVITDRYPGFLRHQLVELGYLKNAHSVQSDSVAFNAQPRITGQLLIGSSRQFGAHTQDIDRDILNRMLRRAIAYMPRLANLSAIREWTGFRAATPDKLPLVGPCPGYKNVFVNTGHEGLGITTSLGTARLLLDRILGRTPMIPFEPFALDRSLAVHA